MEDSIKQASLGRKVATSKWSWFSVLISLLIVFILLQIRSILLQLDFTLTPPKLPEYINTDTPPKFINGGAGWPQEHNKWYHHATQGTATLPIPYQWLIALESPSHFPIINALVDPITSRLNPEPLFIKEYFPRLGFIPSNESSNNPFALPIGVTTTPSVYFPGLDHKADAVGFTCAACHTGQLVHDNKRYLIEGGSATIDLGLLRQSLSAALGQTAASGKLPIVNSRFTRFAKNVLGPNYNLSTANQLNQELTATIKHLVNEPSAVDVTEGYGRTDALNRIGNQVFSAGLGKPENYSPINAPVSFPHIWTTPWFDWVQYDGSIMQPLTRNSGEALGVSAFVDASGPISQRFASTVNITELVKIETFLAGETHPLPNKKFTGLTAPAWPADFPAINQTLAQQGAQLYIEHCQGCHLPPIKEGSEFWTETHWKKISYIKDATKTFEKEETSQLYLKLNIIPLGVIGTDLAQSRVLSTRTVNTNNLELATDLCIPLKNKDSNEEQLTTVKFNDSATASFAYALGAFVSKTNQQWFKQNFITDQDTIKAMEGARPNCLQANKGYKARPLDGVWATAPYLHNGSVASIEQLLAEPTARKRFVVLGDQRIDTKTLGIWQPENTLAKADKYQLANYKMVPDYLDGLFILDAEEPGNYNTGHAFTNQENIPGTIGPALNEDEIAALIEYLKTL